MVLFEPAAVKCFAFPTCCNDDREEVTEERTGGAQLYLTAAQLANGDDDLDDLYDGLSELASKGQTTGFESCGNSSVAAPHGDVRHEEDTVVDDVDEGRKLVDVARTGLLLHLPSGPSEVTGPQGEPPAGEPSSAACPTAGSVGAAADSAASARSPFVPYETLQKPRTTAVVGPAGGRSGRSCRVVISLGEDDPPGSPEGSAGGAAGGAAVAARRDVADVAEASASDETASARGVAEPPPARRDTAASTLPALPAAAPLTGASLARQAPEAGRDEAGSPQGSGSWAEAGEEVFTMSDVAQFDRFTGFHEVGSLDNSTGAFSI